MSFTFITEFDVIPVSNIKGFKINKRERRYTVFEVVVYYINGEDISCEHTYADGFDTHDEAQEFIREKLGDVIIDNE